MAVLLRHVDGFLCWVALPIHCYRHGRNHGLVSSALNGGRYERQDYHIILSDSRGRCRPVVLGVCVPHRLLANCREGSI